MSYKLVEAVLDRGPQHSLQTLVLLAIAEHARDDGAAFPGLPKLAHRSRKSERQTSRILQDLERDGWFTTKRNAAGETGKATLYQLNLSQLGLSSDPQGSEGIAASLDTSTLSHQTLRPSSLDILTFPIVKNREPEEPKTRKPVLLEERKRSGPSSQREVKRNVVRQIFDEYVVCCGRADTYRLTADRMAIGLERLEECLDLTEGDLTKAFGLMRLALDGLVFSDWHMGRNPNSNGRSYKGWEDQLMVSASKFNTFLTNAAEAHAAKSDRGSALEKARAQNERAS